ncbi:MAG: hypothetical protein OXC30_01325 [Alphaproteobacteria bacterium]|nr:hypothetical protein [Alphaproteobacteria bacterium]
MIFLLLFFIALEAYSTAESSSKLLVLDPFEAADAKIRLMRQKKIDWLPYEAHSGNIAQIIKNPAYESDTADNAKIRLRRKKEALLAILEPTKKKYEDYTTIPFDDINNLIEQITVDIEKFLTEQMHLHPLTYKQRLDRTFAEMHARRFPLEDEQIDIPDPLDLKIFLTNHEGEKLDLDAFFYIFSELKEVYASVSSKHSNREAFKKQYKDACALLVSSLEGFCKENPFWCNPKFREFKDALSSLI